MYLEVSSALAMEPTASSSDVPTSRPSRSRSELRSLSQLRDRVEASVREIERLRRENEALAERVAELQDAQSGPSFSFGEGEDTDELKARVQSFIDLVDGLLATEAGESS